MGHGDTTLTTGVSVTVKPGGMEVGLLGRVLLVAKFMVMLVIPHTEHVRQQCGVRFDKMEPMVPDVSLEI